MKNKLMKATLVFLCAFLGFAGGHMAQKLSFTYSMGPLNIFLASMGFIILSFVIHIVMHETGHLIFFWTHHRLSIYLDPFFFHCFD
ncbi:hypothetical protein [Erysipelothrix piscisicarius]|uniref:hypothetical protein n=1 Tax=Erysipelothrix piscisicarius TaxID=2485784 RepID=UPI001E3377EE|nr:hypothetical protein [Erysipelothrix piscisicarius]